MRNRGKIMGVKMTWPYTRPRMGTIKITKENLTQDEIERAISHLDDATMYCQQTARSLQDYFMVTHDLALRNQVVADFEGGEYYGGPWRGMHDIDYIAKMRDELQDILKKFAPEPIIEKRKLR